jgi:prepilin-type N-terminal cleavage/methylation domain-containing protein
MTLLRSGGFSLVEVLVALLVLAVGALGLAAETAALTRQVARARRAARVSAAAALRLERLHAGACNARSSGTELVMQGSVALAALHWSWSSTPDTERTVFQVQVVADPGPLTMGPAVPAETLRAVVSCDW